MNRIVWMFAVLGALAVASGVAIAGTLSGTFTYQGALNDGGSPANGIYDFQFRLFDDPAAGNQLGSLLTVHDVQVTNGVFTVGLNFVTGLFNDQQRWLEISVRPDGLVPYTLLTPRQSLTAAPVAQYALAGGSWRQNGDILRNLNDNKPVLINRDYTITNSEYFGVDAPTTGFGGMYINSQLGGEPFYGYSQGNYVQAWTYVDGNNNSWKVNVNGSDRITVWQDGDVGIGTTTPTSRLDVETAGGTAITGESTSPTGTGVHGQDPEAGVSGSSSAGKGVYEGTGTGYAVYGTNLGSNVNGYAGYFHGRVHVAGTLSKLSGTFKIDHPLDPANKTLSHSFVESPEMMNLYNGNVTTDAEGRATITLPDWFEALNRDFRYQLTPIKSFARAMVEQEIEGNHFVIRTDAPNVRVSWQVSGVRQDPYAKDNPIAVEAEKSATEKGTYLYPAGYAKAGDSASKPAPRAAKVDGSTPLKGGR